MADFYGKVLHWYQCPEGTKEWDHPEWSTNSDYAVASAKPSQTPEKRSNLYILNLNKSSYLPVIKGDDLWHPYLWIGANKQADSLIISLDSAGFYNDPPGNYFQTELALKLPGFWRCKDSIEVLFLGSSRMQNGAAPRIFEPLFAYNMSYAAGGLLGIKNLIYDYALLHCPELKVIAISIDICWYNLPNGDNSWIGGPANTKGFNYDKNHDFWRNGVSSDFLNAVALAPNPFDSVWNAERGWYQGSSAGWGANPALFLDEWKWKSNSNSNASLKTLEDIASDLQDRGIYLIGVIYPMSPYYKNTPVFGASGPDWNTANEIIDKIKDIDKRYDHFTLYDAYNFGNHDFTDEDAQNDSHLSRAGAIKISTRMKSLIDSLLFRQE